jgi:hypothetical protein
LTVVNRPAIAQAMTRTPFIIMLAATAALAGCNNSDHTIVSGPAGETDANTLANEHVTLPPSIQASKSYRCKDNKVIHVDWLSDGTARVKQTKEEVGTSVTPGTELVGDGKATTITYKGQSCKA